MTKKKDVTRTPKSPLSIRKTIVAAELPKRATTTKAATIRRLLAATKGASLDEISVVTGWQVHSVRGFMSGTLKKRLGLEVTSTVHNGCRRYHIVEVAASK